MTENHPSEDQFHGQFQALRKQEAPLAPSFDRIMTMARCQSTPAKGPRIARILVPLSTAALFFLFSGFLLLNREPEPQFLSSSLPVLLEPDPERVPLFAEMEVRSETHRYLSDKLLPLHLRISL
jgi:hypothetical protein